LSAKSSHQQWSAASDRQDIQEVATIHCTRNAEFSCLILVDVRAISQLSKQAESDAAAAAAVAALDARQGRLAWLTESYHWLLACCQSMAERGL